ncbi:MAG: hypothetical protein GY874_01025 [Desulfobacteraceae bacterium]|nr:hypothetical protein [Desulfobacteraceae bacterium]
MLAPALETEIKIFINQYRDLADEMGRQRIVRNDHLPEREIQTGIKAVPVKAPRGRDRHAKASKRMKFRSNILPAYLRKTKGTNPGNPGTGKDESGGRGKGESGGLGKGESGDRQGNPGTGKGIRGTGKGGIRGQARESVMAKMREGESRVDLTLFNFGREPN